MNLFYLLLIQFFIIKKSISKIINNNRIENALKHAISSIENIPTKNNSFELRYQKYSIIYDNFRIIDIDMDNTTINNSSQTEQEEHYFYSIENIKFTFVFNLKFVHYDNFIFEEKDNFIEVNSPEINYKFNYEYDTINFNYLDISEIFNISINSDLGIDKLNYFKNYNERNKCLCKKESEMEYIEEYPDVYIVNFLENLIRYDLTLIEKNDILLNYDIQMIFDKILIRIENLKVKSKNLEFEYVKINKILIPFDKIETLKNDDKNKLIINQMKFFGVFNLSGNDKEYEFKLELNEEENQKIELFNKTLNFNFENILIETNYDEKTISKNDIIEALRFILINNYTKILQNVKDEYYNSYKL